MKFDLIMVRIAELTTLDRKIAIIENGDIIKELCFGCFRTQRAQRGTWVSGADTH